MGRPSVELLADATWLTFGEIIALIREHKFVKEMLKYVKQKRTFELQFIIIHIIIIYQSNYVHTYQDTKYHFRFSSKL